jgi:hypothetical protein
MHYFEGFKKLDYLGTTRVRPDSRPRVEGPPFSFALVQAFLADRQTVHLNMPVDSCVSVLSDLLRRVGNPTFVAFGPEFIAK